LEVKDALPDLARDNRHERNSKEHKFSSIKTRVNVSALETMKTNYKDKLSPDVIKTSLFK